MPGSKVFLDLGPLKAFPQFRRVFFGAGFSSFGSQLGTVAIAYQVFLITRSNLDVGFISLVQLVPAFLGSVLGGSLADAVDRRKLLICTGSVMVLCSSGLAINASAHHPSLLVIYLIAGVNALVLGCDGPARTAMLVTMIDRDNIVSANALRQLQQQVSVIVGPSVGGLLLTSGVSLVFWLNAAAIALSIATVTSVASRATAGGGTRFGVASVVEGFAFLRTRPAIQGSFIADLDAMILGMPTALFPALGLVHFHGGAHAVGYLYAAPGVGALIATVFSGWANHVRRLGLAVCLSVAAWGVSIAIFGLLDSLPIALVLLAFAGAADVVSAIFRATILQVEAPDRLRGRITAYHAAVVTAGPRLGNLEAGGIAAAFGTTTSVVSGGIGCVLGIAVIGRILPKFVSYVLPTASEQAVIGAL
jgi:MFS family permease